MGFRTRRSIASLTAISTSLTLLTLGGLEAHGLTFSDPKTATAFNTALSTPQPHTNFKATNPKPTNENDQPGHDTTAAQNSPATAATAVESTAQPDSPNDTAKHSEDAAEAASTISDSADNIPNQNTTASDTDQHRPEGAAANETAATAPDASTHSSENTSWRNGVSAPIDFANPHDPRLLKGAYATGGSGQHKDKILWLQWKPGDLIDVPNNGRGNPTSLTQYNYTDLSPRTRIITTCTISNLEFSRNRTGHPFSQGYNKPIQSYIPGKWRGDFLDDFYNVNTGNNGPEIRIGITTNSRAAWHYGTPTFTLDCSAQLLSRASDDPNARFTTSLPFEIDGLVISDAEATNYSTAAQEFIEVEPESPVKWYVLDQIQARHPNSVPPSNRLPEPRTNNISDASFGHLGVNRLRLLPNGRDAHSPTPGAVLLAQGTSAAKITVQGHGQQAVALGIMVPSDVGDAPQSYGEAVALFHPTWNNPLQPGYNNLNKHQLTNFGSPKYVLGTNITPDRTTHYSPLADQDHYDDAISETLRFDVSPRQIVTVPVKCTGTGIVAGWIDWDLDGVFQDDEKNLPIGTGPDAQCAGGQVNLQWRVSDDVARVVDEEHFVTEAQSVLRLRTAAPSESPLQPTGPTLSGEVEDHGVQVYSPSLRIFTDVIDTAELVDPAVGLLPAITWQPRAGYTGNIPALNRNFVPGEDGLPLPTQTALTEQGNTVGTRSEVMWNVGHGNFVLSSTPAPGVDVSHYTKTDFVCAKSDGSMSPPGKQYASNFNAATTTLTIPQADHVTCKVTYKPLPGTLTWQKLDETGNHLSGSQWTLRGRSAVNGATVKDCVSAPCTPVAGQLTDTDPRAGYFSVTDLKWGSYELTELKAPAGYVLDTTVHTKAVRGETVDFGQLTNELQAVPDIPFTGGRATIFYLLSGLGLLAIAAVSAVAFGRAERSRGKAH